MERNLTEGSVFKNIIYFSLPYLLSYFLQTLYGMADLFIIGQFEGVASTTAVSIGSQVMHMLTVMIVGLAMGATVNIGQAIGASNNTVRKHVLELEDAGLISTDRTVVIDASGRKRNGNLRYTIHPIQNAVELHHQRQLAALDAVVEQQRVKKRLAASARKGGAAQ